MRVAVVDNWRNVRSTPAEPLTAASDVVAVLRELLSRHLNAADNPHVEIECDAEFYDALEGVEADSRQIRGFAFDGVPIVVSAPAPIPVVAEPPAEEAPPSPTTTRKR